MKFVYKTNEKAFYDLIREKLFSGSINTKQFSGIDAILNLFDGLDYRYAAYALATAYHETAKTMQPIEEYEEGKGYKYGKKVKMSGTPYVSPDKIYFGRGFVQLTWFENYQNMTNAAQRAGHDWNFLTSPELMLQDEPAGWVMKYGMLNGSFTGKKLSDYFNNKVEQPINARKIINGNDQSIKIAGYYEIFKEALSVYFY